MSEEKENLNKNQAEQNAEQPVNQPETADVDNGQEKPSDETTNEEGEKIEVQTESPISEVDQLKQEVGEVKEKYVRLYAEFENFRRRTAKEKNDIIKSASEGLMRDLLPVLDDFQRALKSMSDAEQLEVNSKDDMIKEIKAVEEGLKLVFNKLFKVLEQKGLKPMESSIGKPFDLEQHESITQIPAPSEDLKGKVVDEIEKGYYLHDKVLRFAKVVVGS